MKPKEEIWDSHSEYIEDDSSSFQMVAGTSVIHRGSFFRALNEYSNSQNSILLELVEAQEELNNMHEKAIEEMWPLKEWSQQIQPLQNKINELKSKL